MLSADQQRDLQRELASMDMAIRQTLGAGQLQLGAGDLALRGELGRGQLDLGYDQLGAQTGYNQAALNQQALMALMGGWG